MLDLSQNKSKAQQAERNVIGMLSEEDTLIAKGTKQKPPVLARPAHRPVRAVAAITEPEVLIRDAEDTDAPGLANVVAAVMAEFPGCIFDLEADFPELRQPGSSFKKEGGRFWVAEYCAPSEAVEMRQIAGCFGFLPAEDPSGIEMVRVYLRPELRGTGLAVKMFKIVQAIARQRSASFIELWTDRRFKAAQRFYEKLGFVRQPGERLLNDRSRSSEYHYLLQLR